MAVNIPLKEDTEAIVAQQIAEALVGVLTEAQITALFNTLIQKAEQSGEIATETWVEGQEYLQRVATDGSTVTGDGTVGSPLKAQGGGGGSNVTYNRATGALTVNGETVEVLNLGDAGNLTLGYLLAKNLVESLGGGLFGNFLQNEEGKDYLLRETADETYLKKTDLVIDGTPTEGSSNLVTSGAVYAMITQVNNDLTAHVKHDADLYQSIIAAARQEAQDTYEGSNPPLSSTGVTVIGTGGLIDVGSSGQYIAPGNGGITITFSAVLSLGNATVMVNGEEVFNSSVISLLAVPPPVTIRVNGGDVITSGGALGVLSSLNVTFYPNKEIA